MVQFEIHQVTASELLARIPDMSVHLVITDPPYFIDGLEDNWDIDSLARRKAGSGTVGGLPSGMRFSREQGVRLQQFIAPIAREIFRVLKPGGFLIVFCQGRLYHRMTIAIEDAGFEIRDMLAWSRPGQAKAQGQEHHVRRHMRQGLVTPAEGARMIKALEGRKTPQLAPYFEPMALAMRPVDGTFVGNWMRHQTGLIDATIRIDGRFPSNLISVPKPGKAEKGEFNTHITVKPVDLIGLLIQIFSRKGQIVLDPFMGSGSHGVAALQAGRYFLGCEPVQEYFSISMRRLENALPPTLQTLTGDIFTPNGIPFGK